MIIKTIGGQMDGVPRCEVGEVTTRERRHSSWIEVLRVSWRAGDMSCKVDEKCSASASGGCVPKSGGGSDRDCATGQACTSNGTCAQSGTCATHCTTAADCMAGEKCSAGLRRDLKPSTVHCVIDASLRSISRAAR